MSKNHYDVRNIDFHGVLWLFVQLIEHEILGEESALSKLNLLIKLTPLLKGAAS